jgi:hemoglobin-like flavoprotein
MRMKQNAGRLAGHPAGSAISLDAAQVALVRNSHALVPPIAAPAAALFYQHLFDAEPGLRELFRGDMAQQGERLMAMIGGAVGLLDRTEALGLLLRQLGTRHVGYGVQGAHYASVGAALLKTLAQGLGPAFTPEVREAWVAFYGWVSQTMQQGVAQPAMLA